MMKKFLLFIGMFFLLSGNVYATNTYIAGGRFSEDLIGWKLPDLETEVELQDLGGNTTIGTDVYGGLYKASKLTTAAIGSQWIPYDNMEYLEHETPTRLQEIYNQYFKEQLVLENLSNSLTLPVKKDWNQKIVGDSYFFSSSDEDGLEFELKGGPATPLDSAGLKKKIGEVYAERYGKLLDEYDRQSFYLYDNINDNKAALITLGYGGKNIDDIFTMEIHAFESVGEERIIKVSSTKAEEVIGWYMVFLYTNGLGQAVGYRE